MFADEPSPFKPTLPSRWPVAAIVVAVVGTAFVFGYFTQAPTRKTIAAKANQSRAGVANSLSANQVAPKPALRTGELVESANQVAPLVRSMRPPAAPVEQSVPSRITIYLCKAYSGGSFWSTATCSSQKASIDRMTSVPASLDFQQQIAIARGEAAEAALLYQAPETVRASPMEAAAPVRRRPYMCEVYEQQIRDLDAAARQPQTPRVQDQIRTDRMNVMSARVRERC